PEWKKIESMCREIESDTLKVIAVNGVTKHDAKHLAAAESAAWIWFEAGNRLLDWLRLNKSTRDQMRDGLYWKNLGISFSDLILLVLLQNFRWLLKLIGPLIGKISSHIATNQILSSGQLIIFLAKD